MYSDTNRGMSTHSSEEKHFSEVFLTGWENPVLMADAISQNKTKILLND